MNYVEDTYKDPRLCYYLSKLKKIDLGSLVIKYPK